MQDNKHLKTLEYFEKYGEELKTLQAAGTINWQQVAEKVSFLASQTIDKEYIRKKFQKWKKGKSPNEFTVEGSGIFVCNSSLPDYLKYSYTENRDKGEAKLEDTVERREYTDDEIYEKYKVNKKKYKISNIYYKDQANDKVRLTVLFRALTQEDNAKTLELSPDFVSRLSNITALPVLGIKSISDFNKKNACLVIPKQDSHWNKQDLFGSNSIEERFANFTKELVNQVDKASISNNLEEIVYIVGSDEFNSEWTNFTTKGTPQQNILSYEEAFEKITEFNIEVIKILKFYCSRLKVVFLSGNHDQYSGWHLAHVLKAVFKKNENISIDSEINATKTISYKSNLLLLNHGDVIKPRDLASKFPIIAHDKWSNHSNYYILCGDKHHEVAHDFNGIMFYQVPQLSTAKSRWDDRQGFSTSKAELLTFLFEEDGLSNIMRKILK